ncbi:phosphatase and actin regulator 2-like isoform X1 [Sycon ciliatum]|uniref:phosphatase and actin regulator 2-like isoform X1 n=1 Tax=Sycon ciliatum TaxID=27933 RepID=UPI0031F6B1A5
MAALSSPVRSRAVSDVSAVSSDQKASSSANGVSVGTTAEAGVPPTRGTKKRLTTFQKIFRPWKWKKRRRVGKEPPHADGEAAAQGVESGLTEPTGNADESDSAAATSPSAATALPPEQPLHDTPPEVTQDDTGVQSAASIQAMEEAEAFKRRRASSEADLLTMDDYVAEPRVTLVPVGVSLFRPGHRMPGDAESQPAEELPVISDPELVEMIRTSKKENATPSPVHDKPRRRKTGNSSILVSSTSPHASPAVSQASSSNDSGQSTVGGADGPRQPVASAAATSNGNGAAVSTDGGSSNRANDSDSDDEDVPATGLAAKVKRKDTLNRHIEGDNPTQWKRSAASEDDDSESEDVRKERAVVGNKLVRRLSQRPSKEELEQRNILHRHSTDEIHMARDEVKSTLQRKLSRRPTIKELRERNILIHFANYCEVTGAVDYDRHADKPWTRLRGPDKALIRRELNEFKSSEMEVHPDSAYMTRFHKP